MLIIRLQRTGKKNQADFRIVLAEKQAPVKKKFVEVLGSYNPRRKIFAINQERLSYWLGTKVPCSETVHNLLVSQGLLQGAKIKAFTIPKKPVEPVAAEKPAEVAAAETPPAEIPAEPAPAPAAAEQPAAPAVEAPAPALEPEAEAKQ